MGQDSKGISIADDYASIAARLRELGSRSGQAAMRVECGACDDRGWLWSGTVLNWSRCPRCGMSQHRPKPPPRR
jgi:predicted Zn-ribbon and HTH transcriptional regulator